MDAIDVFLAQQSDAGQTDSEGTFTVSGERALEKLANFQLPRTSAWILKMLQAGVVAQAAGIWVSHGARSCKIRYKKAQLGELEEFERFWGNPSPVLTPAQAELLVALRTVGFARKRPVLIGHNSERFGLRTLFWNGHTLSPIEPVAGALATRLKIGWPDEGEMIFYISGSPLGQDDSARSLHGVKNVVAAEFKELQKYGVCCPVPAWVESRPLNHFGLQDVSMTRKALAFSAQVPEEEHSGPLLMLPPSVYSEKGLEAGSRLAWTLYRSDEPGPSRVSWVRNGVVCEEENLHSPSDVHQVRLFVPAEDLETDLTALQLRFPEEKERFRRVAEAVLRFSNEIEPDSPVVRRIASEQRSVGKTWASAAALVFGGVILAPLTAGYSLLAGGAAAIGVGVQEQRHAKRRKLPELEHFRQTLIRRYGGHE